MTRVRWILWGFQNDHPRTRAGKAKDKRRIRQNYEGTVNSEAPKKDHPRMTTQEGKDKPWINEASAQGPYHELRYSLSTMYPSMLG